MLPPPPPPPQSISPPLPPLPPKTKRPSLNLKRYYRYLGFGGGPLIVLILIVFVGLSGQVPVVSDILGASKARDLGVGTSESHLNNFISKAGIDFKKGEVREAGGPTEYEGERSLAVFITNEELSSLLAFSDLECCQLKNPQLKIYKDGNIEFSANLLMKPDSGYEYKNAIYAKFKMQAVSTRTLRLKFEKIELGRLPHVLSEKTKAIIETQFNHALQVIPGFSIGAIGYEDGGINFSGTLPAIIKTSGN